jgi:WD40 repeat protein
MSVHHKVVYIGLLELSTTQYSTRLRSHNREITALAMDPNRDEFATASRDGTIRIWTLHTHAQIYEFSTGGASASITSSASTGGEICTALAYHPQSSQYQLACGFMNGSVRIVSITNTSMLYDFHQHSSAVMDIVYSHDGLFLYSCVAPNSNSDASLCCYDVQQEYRPVRMFALSQGGNANGNLSSRSTLINNNSASSLAPFAQGGAVTRSGQSSGIQTARSNTSDTQSIVDIKQHARLHSTRIPTPIEPPAAHTLAISSDDWG